MPIVDKQLFANALRERLSDKLTAKDVELVLSELTYEMSYYDMLRREDNCAEKEFDEMVELFISTKRIEGKSETTIENYSYLLRRFREKDKTPIREITVYNLRQWLAAEKARGISDRTLQGNRFVFTSFFGWLHREGLIDNNPCTNLKPIKCKKELRVPYSDVDLERFREIFKTPRDKALISFFASPSFHVRSAIYIPKNTFWFLLEASRRIMPAKSSSSDKK